MLVLLRITIGWHFLYQGCTKLREGDFSSRPYLSQAKGPLADFYHGMIPDYDGLDRLNDKTMAAHYADLYEGARGHFGWNMAQSDLAKAKQSEFVADLNDYLAENKEAIDRYKQDLDALADSKRAQDAPNSFRQKRAWDKQQELQTTVGEWLAWIDDHTKAYIAALNAVADTDQRDDAGEYCAPLDDLAWKDRLVLYSNLVIGVCLIVGLFTRLASFSGGCFLLMLVLAQPPLPNLYPPPHPSAGAAWLVNKEVVEMMAMFALAALPVGRWGGLDFFVHHCITRPLFGRKDQA